MTNQLLSNKKILLISPEPWHSIFVSKHHYAIYLGKRGNQVYFLNPPANNYSIEKTSYKNVNSVLYPGFIRGLRFYPAVIQRYVMNLVLSELETLCETKFDIIWSFDNSVFYDLSFLPKGVLRICHIVDLNQNFQFGQAAKTADICFCTTDLLKQKLRQYNSKAFKINHGVHQADNIINVILPGENNQKALYLGNLAMRYLDWQIIHEAVSENPKIDFVFIGSNSDNFDDQINVTHSYKKKLKEEAENCFILDKIPSERISSYLLAADVLLIAYQEKFHQDQANPHKMMEYLLSGKPIVATFTAEYRSLKDCICMAEKNIQWATVFKGCITSIEKHNSEESVGKRKKFALDNTYEKQIERIENLIDGGIIN